MLAVVLAMGVPGASDFGLAADQGIQRNIAKFTVEYVRGETDNLLTYDYRYYGSAFELLLYAAERLLGLTDTAEVFESRYVLSHGFFLLGAFACYLLANRLFQSRMLAVFAMLLLLCHPRLHGHSFFNSKDTPFLAMYMIALLLAHWTLRCGGVLGHAALGAWIGLVASVRPFAFLLLALVALPHVTDFLRGSGRERWRIVAALAAQGLAAVVACVIALPYLWGDPALRVVEWLTEVTDHRVVGGSRFLGEQIASNDRPWSYLPVWISVTTPPVVVLLALVGVAALAVRSVRSPYAAFSNTRLGFEVLLAASVVAPIAAATFAGSLYNGWRHLYFVYGPACLLACAGLAWLVRDGGRRLASLAAAAAALGVAAAFGWILRLHPHQHVYFNFLVDRNTPERLGSQFDLDYWWVPYKDALEYLLRVHPEGEVPVTGIILNSEAVLPKPQRDRIVRGNTSAYFLSGYRRAWYWTNGGLSETYARPVYVRKVFSNTLYRIMRLEVDLQDARNQDYKLHYQAALSRPPDAIAPVALSHSRFAVHWDGRAVTYIGEKCQAGDVAGGLPYHRWGDRSAGRFLLRIVGEQLQPVADPSRGQSPHNEDFWFYERGVVLVGAGDNRGEAESRVCMARVDLSGYWVDALETGQLAAAGERAWSVRIAAADRDELGQALTRVSAREPAARGRFDVHVDEDALVYVRQDCSDADAAAAFHLRAVPFVASGLSFDLAERGFVARDFAFETHGAMFGNTCVLRTPLPPFRVREVRTGQRVNDDELWRVDFALPSD